LAAASPAKPKKIYGLTKGVSYDFWKPVERTE
jgi:hypothetical protein